MNIMRLTLIKRQREEALVFAFETKGYVTKATRKKYLKELKRHNNDTFAIAVGRDGFGFKEKIHYKKDGQNLPDISREPAQPKVAQRDF